MSVLGDVRAGAVTILQSVAAAHPTSLGQVYTARPASLAPPCAYVGDVRMDLAHDSGTRRWSGSLDVVLVDTVADNPETMGRLDTATAYVVDAFTDAPHALGLNTVAEPVSVRSMSLEQNGVIYEAVVVTVGRFVYQEGR